MTPVALIERLLAEKEEKGLSKPASRKADMDGVSLGKDKRGFFVYTHRARSKSYPSAEAIPKSVCRDIETTG